MPVIYLDKRRRLTEEQKKMAEVALSNEINDVMADLEIMEEELDRTFLFKGLSLRECALRHLQMYPRSKDEISFNDEVLKDAYRYYFGTDR